MVQNLSSDLPVSRLLPVDHVAPLVLQVRGSERDGQVVRIRSTRCLVGRSAQADFRLVAAGVRAKHCALYRGAAGTLLKALCRDVRVNGHPVTEHLLRSGDLLGIGSIEFEVLPGNDAEKNLAPSLESTPTRPAALESQLRKARGNGRNRVRHLIRTLRKLRDEEGESREDSPGDDPYRTIVLETEGDRDRRPKHDLQAEIAAVRRRGKLRVQACIGQLRKLREESAATRAEIQEVNTRLEAKTAALTEAHQRIEQELEQSRQRESELQRQTELQRDLESERDQHLAEAEGLRKEVDLLRAQIQEVEQQLNEARDAAPAESQDDLRQELEHLKASNKQLREDLAYLQASESELRGEWQVVRAENQRLAAELESAERQLQEASVNVDAESTEEAPVSSSEVFARLREAGMLKLDLADAETPEEEAYDEPARDAYAGGSVANRFSEASSPFSGAMPSGEPIDEDEEHAQSINDYVANLLKRTGRSGSDSQAAPVAPPKKPAPVRQVESESNEKLTEEQYRPKATAPERNTDISQLRQVANATAQAAIGSHTLNRWQRQLRSKTLSAGLALVAGCSLTALVILTDGADLPAGLTAVISFGMTAFWGMQAVVAYRQLQSHGRRVTDVDPTAAPDRRDEPVAGRRRTLEERVLAELEAESQDTSADSAED